MGIEIPGWLRGVAKIAVGEDWPDGDETAMRRLADSWHEMSIKIADTSTLGDDAANATLATVEGAVHEAIEAHWKKLGHEGLTKLQELTDHMQEVLEEGAADIEKAKLDILAALAILAAQLAADVGVAIATFGVGGAAMAAGETAATQFTIRMIIRELIEKLLSRAMAKTIAMEAGKTALLNVTKDIGTQVYQVANDNRDSVSFKDLWKKDIGGGLAEGAASGLFGKDGLGDFVTEGSSPLRKMATNAGVDAVADTAGKVSEKVATGDADKIDWSTFTSSAIGGAAGGAMEGHKISNALGDGGQMHAAAAAAAAITASKSDDSTTQADGDETNWGSLNL